MSKTRQSLTHRTVAGMLWMSYGKAAFHVLQLVVLAVLARLLTPAEFGVVTAALIVTGPSALVSPIGVGPAPTFVLCHPAPYGPITCRCRPQ